MSKSAKTTTKTTKATQTADHKPRSFGSNKIAIDPDRLRLRTSWGEDRKRIAEAFGIAPTTLAKRIRESDSLRDAENAGLKIWTASQKAVDSLRKEVEALEVERDNRLAGLVVALEAEKSRPHIDGAPKTDCTEMVDLEPEREAELEKGVDDIGKKLGEIEKNLAGAMAFRQLREDMIAGMGSHDSLDGSLGSEGLAEVLKAEIVAMVLYEQNVIKPFYDERRRILAEAEKRLGVGAHFQDEETGLVFLIEENEGKFVFFDPVRISRTKLPDERAGSLSVVRAQGLGYDLKK